MPEAYARLVKQDFERNEARRRSDVLSFSVTTLSGPAYKFKLSKRHEAEVEIDVVDQFLSFRGQMMHKVLQDGNLRNAFHEPEIGMQFHGVWLTGRPDIVLPFEIDDFKMKTVESYWNQRDTAADLEKQLNPYRFILQAAFDLPIRKLTGHIFLMNWVKRRAQFEQGYPSKPHYEIDVPVWPHEVTAAYLTERIDLFCLPFEKTEICTPEERWRHETVYSVKKEENKKATRNFKSLAEAEAFIESLKDKKAKYLIEEKPGVDARCVGYCNPNKFCPYWIEHYSQAPQGTEETEEDLS
jgi:hypothetical protein